MDTIEVDGKYIVHHDQSLVFTDTGGFYLLENDETGDKLVNAGHVLVTTDLATDIYGVRGYYYGQQTFLNAATGSFVVEANGAYGYAVGVAINGDAVNAGYLAVSSAHAVAEGMSCGGDATNSGELQVSGGQAAFGIETQGGHTLNTGLIHVSGGDGATGVTVSQAGAFDNPGDTSVGGESGLLVGVCYSLGYYDPSPS